MEKIVDNFGEYCVILIVCVGVLGAPADWRMGPIPESKCGEGMFVLLFCCFRLSFLSEVLLRWAQDTTEDGVFGFL